MKNNKLALSLILSLILAGSAFAGKRSSSYEENKVVTKEFPLKKGESLKVSNEFGKIHFENWDQQKVSFEINIVIVNNSEKKAKSIAESIEPRFSQTAGKGVVCDVSIPGKINNGNNESIEVNVDVKMPKGVSLDVSNSFGDIYLPDLEGDLDLKIQYGELQAGNLRGSKNKLDISFGGADAGSVNNGDVTISYSDFELGSCDKLLLNSQFSQGEAKNVKELEARVTYGEFEADDVEELKGDFEFSSVEIESIAESALFKSFYGDGVEIGTIKKDFKKIDVTAQFASVELNFESGSSFKLEAKIDFGDLDYDKDDFKKIWEDKAEYVPSATYKGIYGNADNPSSEVTIRAEYGDIEIN